MKNTNSTIKLNAFDRFLHRLVDKFMKHEHKIGNFCCWTMIASILAFFALVYCIYGACVISPLDLWVNVIGYCIVAVFACGFIPCLFRPLVMLYGFVTGK